METIRWRSKGAVPNGYLMESTTKEIDAYLRCQKLEGEIAKLKEMHEQTRKRERSLDDVKRTFSESFNEFRETSLVDSLCQFIRDNSKHSDPATRLKLLYLDHELRAPIIPDSLIDKAFSALADQWPSDAITDSDRARELRAIEKEIQKNKKALAKFELHEDWKIFINAWVKLQNKAREGVDPQGFDIRSAPETMKMMYQIFGIGKCINPDGLLPVKR